MKNETKHLVLEVEHELLKGVEYWDQKNEFSIMTNSYVSGILDMTDAILEQLEKVDE